MLNMTDFSVIKLKSWEGTGDEAIMSHSRLHKWLIILCTNNSTQHTPGALACDSAGLAAACCDIGRQ